MATHVLVIGAAGSIGQLLIKELVKRNGPHTVIAGNVFNITPHHMLTLLTRISY